MEILPFALPDISRAEVSAVTECLESGWLTSGRKVQEFEAAFARTLKCGHAIAVNSATAGALLTLDALGVALKEHVDQVIGKTPAVDLPNGLSVAPTKDNLQKIDAL